MHDNKENPTVSNGIGASPLRSELQILLSRLPLAPQQTQNVAGVSYPVSYKNNVPANWGKYKVSSNFYLVFITDF